MSPKHRRPARVPAVAAAELPLSVDPMKILAENRPVRAPEVAMILKTSRNTITRSCRSGRIPARQVGTEWLISRTWFADLVKQLGLADAGGLLANNSAMPVRR
jgi:excisionase family DNA binding protein